MRTIIRRLRQLEGRLVPEVDQRTWATANLLRERRRLRLEASGQPFVDVPRVPMLSGKCMTISETLRHSRRERLAALYQKREDVAPLTRDTVRRLGRLESRFANSRPKHFSARILLVNPELGLTGVMVIEDDKPMTRVAGTPEEVEKVRADLDRSSLAYFWQVSTQQ
jgi:hypothetical protein